MTPTTAAIDDEIAPRRSFARLGVVERQSSPTDDDDARLCFARTIAWPRPGLNLSAIQGDEVQKQVAEVAKALYQRTDELAVLLARAITRPFVVVAADVRLSASRRCCRSRARCAASTCIPRGSADA